MSHKKLYLLGLMTVKLVLMTRYLSEAEFERWKEVLDNILKNPKYQQVYKLTWLKSTTVQQGLQEEETDRSVVYLLNVKKDCIDVTLAWEDQI